jgi:hypothetical protein
MASLSSLVRHSYLSQQRKISFLDTSENGLTRGLYPQTICDAHAKPSASRQTNDLDHVKESCSRTR